MPGKRLRAFVLMPFDEELAWVYEKLIKPAFKSASFETRRADNIASQQNILKDIVTAIAESDVVVADLTKDNPNVYYELGLAHALRKQVVLISQDIETAPFDLRSYRILEYGDRFDLFENAKKQLTELARGVADGSIQFGSPVSDFGSTKGQLESLVPALSPEAQELLIKAANGTAGAVLILKLSEGTSISCGKEFTQRGTPRSEAKWKRAVEELQQAGFLEDGDGSSRKVTDAGFQMADTLSGKEQSPAAQAAETERLTAGLSPAVPDPSVPPPTPPERPGPDGILHYPAHWYALPLLGTEELIDVRHVENAAELDELKASDPTREWWDTPAKWPGLECAEIRRVDGRRCR